MSGRRWLHAAAPLAEVAARAQSLDLPEILAEILVARAIPMDATERFLAPTLRESLPDPSCLAEMDHAALRLADAVAAGEVVAVFGDYDVDGACAGALLAGLLRDLGCTVLTHVPNRMTEGYGPNVASLRSLVARGARLIVCVDCGTAAEPAFSELRHEADLLVLDHHLAPVRPDSALAVVNPNLPADHSGLGGLCATAIVFLTGVALLRALRGRGFFAGRTQPDLLEALDLVALATVCDMMPLSGLNRAFVVQGLKVMGRRARPGLAALLRAANHPEPPSAVTCGFVLGPRINAAGRIAESDLGTELLLAHDPAEAEGLARALDAINRDRQQIEAGMLAAAMAQAEAQMAAGRAVLMVSAPQWHPGVVGIIAGRIKEKFNRPACAAALADGLARGSGRSVAGFDLGQAVLAAHAGGLLQTGGGHAMACGFGLAEAALAAFHAFLDETLAGARLLPAAPDLQIDAVLSAPAANEAIAAAIARMAPYGPANPEPVVMLARMRVAYADRVGRDGNTVRAELLDEAGVKVRAVAFRASDSALGAALLARPGVLHVAGHLRLESRPGRSGSSFVLLDAARA